MTLADAPPEGSPPPAAPSDAVARSAGRDGISIISIVVACGALFFAVFAIALGWRAVDESKAGGSSSSEPVMVSLAEFKIAPTTVGAGGSLHVMNDGTMPHNLSIEGSDLKTADLAAGESEVLDISSLTPGTYTMVCLVPGHKDSGMKTTLTVTEAGAATSSAATAGAGMDHATMSEADYQVMTDKIMATMKAYPAETAGVGNPPLEPTEITPDGTKIFDLDMKIVDWQVAPDQTVKAWTFNGTVPGPLIQLEIGEKAQVRVKNSLPLQTDVHWHGTSNNNANDGVAPYTQDLIDPGTTFTYDISTEKTAVAMYHPHMHGQQLLPDGMFGVILVGHVPLPTGRTISGIEIPSDLTVSQEFPMVLNDSGVISYSLNGKSFPATAPVAANVGDWMLVHYFNEGTQIHPMHLHAFPQVVIAKDGLPLDEPYAADTINVAPGERYSVLIKIDKPGTWVWHCHILPHVEKEDAMYGMVTAIVATDPNAP